MFFHGSFQSKALYKKTLAILILALCPLLITVTQGQFKATKVTRSNNIMVQDGKKYYMHEIKEGQTLYSVSKAYSVSPKILSQENPNVPHISSGTLPLGVVIRIPYVEDIEESPEIDKDYNLYYYHTVEPKETLSSLSRQYKVHYKKIIEHNPGVENNLPIGIELRIPKAQEIQEVQKQIISNEVTTGQVSPDVEIAENRPDTVYLYHKVKKGENIFRLANYYGLRMRDLKDANPGLRWGLKENEIIKIPKALITNPDLIQVKEELKQVDDKIIADEIKEIEQPGDLVDKNDCVDFLRPHDDQIFEVAFLLPLYLDINDTLHINDTLPYSAYDIYEVRFLEFLEGAYMAIDSLKNYGLRMNVSIYDTERNPIVVRDLFESRRLDNADLIIGPVYSRPLAVASDYSRELEIPLISPLSANGIGLNDNPYLFQVNPGDEIQYELASLFLADFYDMNMIMVQDTSSFNPIARKSGSKIFDYLTYKVNPGDLLSGKVKFRPAIAEDLPDQAEMAPVEKLLSKTRENLVLIPIDNKIFVTDMMNKLNALALQYDIRVFGRPEWGSYESIELEYLYNLNLHYYSNFSNPYVNYSDSLTLDFCEKYRLNWNNEPSRFSFQGFDVSFYFFKALYLYGNDFIKCISCWENVLNHQPIQTNFCFQRVRDGKGFENQAFSIIRYNSETLTKELARATLIQKPIRKLEENIK